MSKVHDAGQTSHDRAGETTRPDDPELEGGTPLPEEVTGRASGTREDLGALFANGDAGHLADGFRGGSDDDSGSDFAKGDDAKPDAEQDVTAV